MQKVNNFIKRHSGKIIWLAILIYSLIFAAICIWKYNYFLYNALDLAIINNVFYNTLHGHWFWSSIQGHSYLGDHFTPILILLMPIYTLWQSPEILLILQSFFLGLAAWPIYLISKLILKDYTLALGIALLWLINPLVHNINLFEFHFISILPVALLTLFYIYLKLKEKDNKKLLFYFFIILFLNLIIREDVAFIILIFLIIALINTWKTFKNKTNFYFYQILRVITYGLLITFGWIILSNKFIAHFSPSNFSPFVYYYQWLWQADIILILKHLFSLNNFEMLAGLLLPFLFIPLATPKWLLIAIIPLEQIIFSATGGGALIWQMHYGALFLPAIMIAFIYGFKKTNLMTTKYFNNKYLLVIILLIVNVYLWQGLGPFTLKSINIKGQNNFNKILENIKKDDTILAGYRILANLSSRQNIYALNYFFLGQQQFGQGKYLLKQEPNYIIFNQQDLINFKVQLANLKWSKRYYQQGDNRLIKLIKNYGLVEITENIMLFKKNVKNKFNFLTVDKQQVTLNKWLSTSNSRQNYIFDDKIKLVNYSWQEKNNQLEFNLSFQRLQQINDDYQLSLKFYDGINKYKKILPMAYGIYPTSEWQDNEIININYLLNLPENFDLAKTEVKLNLIELSGGVEMNKFGMTKLVIDEEKTIGGSVVQKLIPLVE